MPEPRRYCFFDTVTLSNFALTQRLDLLILRYGRRAQVTQEVLDEVSDGIVAGYDALQSIMDAVAARKLGAAAPLSAVEREEYGKLLRVLASGEASCIACADKRGGIVATDDRTARASCTERGIRCTGTIGILKACAAGGSLSPHDADAVLQAMIDAGYHAPVQRISDIL